MEKKSTSGKTRYTAAEYKAVRPCSRTALSAMQNHPVPVRTGDQTSEALSAFRVYLVARDMKANTVDKYLRDVKHFLYFNQGRDLDHDAVACFRDYLTDFYEPASANSMLAALNRFLKYVGREDCCVHVLRVQREIFRKESKDMTVEEYQRLVIQAEKEGNQRLAHMIQTMAGCGIRVGELPAVTVEALDQPTVSIHSKGKIRQILLPDSLAEKLRVYCRTMGLTSGCIFVTRSGRPVDRRNIWKEMKNLCRRAGVDESKTFPHNLRHLFARCFYEKEKDIVRLADYLGHSNVETTRRYTVTSQMEDCKKALEMGLVVNTESVRPETSGSSGHRKGRYEKKPEAGGTGAVCMDRDWKKAAGNTMGQYRPASGDASGTVQTESGHKWKQGGRASEIKK